MRNPAYEDDPLVREDHDRQRCVRPDPGGCG